MSHAEDVQRNRDVWTKANAEYTDAKAREAWAEDEIDWGMFSGPESEIGALGEVAGKDVVELGCGTAYFGALLAKRGARVTEIVDGDGHIGSGQSADVDIVYDWRSAMSLRPPSLRRRLR